MYGAPEIITISWGYNPSSPSPSAYTVGVVNGPNGWAAMDSSLFKSFLGSGTANYLVGLQWNNRLSRRQHLVRRGQAHLRTTRLGSASARYLAYDRAPLWGRVAIPATESH